MKTPNDLLHLVLTRHWYDETVSGRKRTEYREQTTTDKNTGEVKPSRWVRDIWGKREHIKRVRFARAYTKTTATFAVTHIDLGPCPIPGWDGEYIRIHFTDLSLPQIMNTKNTPNAAATPTPDALRVITSDKKYAFVLSADGSAYAMRHDQLWRDCTGDKLVLTLAQDLDQSRTELAARDALIGELRQFGNVMRAYASKAPDIWQEDLEHWDALLARTPADAGAELERLREELEGCRRSYAARDCIGMTHSDYHRAKKALEENDKMRANLASAEAKAEVIAEELLASNAGLNAERRRAEAAEARVRELEDAHIINGGAMAEEIEARAKAEARLAAVLGAADTMRACFNVGRKWEDACIAYDAARTGDAAHPDSVKLAAVIPWNVGPARGCNIGTAGTSSDGKTAMWGDGDMLLIVVETAATKDRAASYDVDLVTVDCDEDYFLLRCASEGIRGEPYDPWTINEVSWWAKIDPRKIAKAGAGVDIPALLADKAIVDWLASRWESQATTVQQIAGGLWLENPTGSFRDAVNAARKEGSK